MRVIDPQILSDPWYVSLSLEARLFWLSLLLAADDQGRIVANPALLRSSLFPADDLPLARVAELLEQVRGPLLLYTIEGVQYGQIVAWWKYQYRAAWMAPSRFPPPEGWEDRYRYQGVGRKIVRSDSWETSGGFSDQSLRSALPSGLPRALPVGVPDVLPSDEEEEEGKEEGKEEAEAEDLVVVVAQRAAAASAPAEPGRGVAVLRAYEIHIGPHTPGQIPLLLELEDEYGAEWVCAAIEEAATRDMRDLMYVQAILSRWRRHGIEADGPPTGSGR